MACDLIVNHVKPKKKVEEVKVEPKPEKEIVIPMAKATKPKKKRVFKRRNK